MTAEDWSPYGIGEPDADGWYPDYRPVPEHLKPSAVAVGPAKPAVELDTSWLAIVLAWRAVVADLGERGVDLYDPAVQSRSWLGVRSMIFALVDTPGSWLWRALPRR